MGLFFFLEVEYLFDNLKILIYFKGIFIDIL